MEQMGFYFVSWGMHNPDVYGGEYDYPFRHPFTHGILQRAKDMGANRAILYWRCMMSDRFSNEIQLTHSWATELDENIMHAVIDLHDLGFKYIELMPTVEVEDGTWSGDIAPTDVDAWFASYANFINHYADLAESLKDKITGLTIGHELKSMLGYEGKWRDIINGVRTRTTLPLSWHAATQEWTAGLIDFWDALDAASIATYFPLTATKDPTVEEIIAGWRVYIEQAATWHYNKCPRLPVFTSACYGAFDGQCMTGRRDPVVGDTPDVQEQADLMEAHFRAWWKIPWLTGLDYYSMDLFGRGGDPANGMSYMSSMCNGKPIEDVIAEYFKLAPAPPIPLWKVAATILSALGGGAAAYYGYKKLKRRG